MIFQAWTALAVAVLRVAGFPTDQQVLTSVGTAFEAGGIEDVRKEQVVTTPESGTRR
jgi:hypothetical protein